MRFAVVLAVLSVAGVAACNPPKDEAAAPAAPPKPSKYTEVESPGAGRETAGGYRSDVIDVLVAGKGDPEKGDQIEYMVKMKAGDVLTYDWEAQDVDNFWHEFHGHTEDTVTFYRKAEGVRHDGALIAPFDGIHGWYFENRSPGQAVVKLRISGFYELDEPKPK